MNTTSNQSSLTEVQSFLHDLRNPLSAIHGGAEILVRSNLSQPQVHRIARNMCCAAIRIRELLELCLDRSRCRTKKVEIADLRAVVAAAVDRIAVSAEFQAVQIVQAIPERLRIAMDLNRIHRALVNLLVNALEVMPQGGTIHVSAIPEGRSVLIRVRDTGPGIAPEIRDRLFQPFATAGKAGGLGLGLAFSRQAAIDHGGEIWAESPSRGACLVIRLPRTLAKPRAASR
uniref:histidine kinase n=1 Tax=Solibacter usitatus (strain Ellin6076) TaxID=234267 RepID=Q022K8_SOLUE